jgi:hypothetical protein
MPTLILICEGGSAHHFSRRKDRKKDLKRKSIKKYIKEYIMNYQNGKVYKIVSNINGKFYIGSTCMPSLCQRLAKHHSDYKTYLDGKRHYIISFEILEKGNYDIILLELFPCNSKEELHSRERYYIENNQCVNKMIPTKTNKEYRIQNKEKIKIKKRIIGKIIRKYLVSNMKNIMRTIKI